MAVFNTVGEAIISTDEEGSVLSVNSEAARLWEYDFEDAPGQRLDHFFVEPGFFAEASEQCRAHRNAHLRRGRGHFPHRAPLPRRCRL